MNDVRTPFRIVVGTQTVVCGHVQCRCAIADALVFRNAQNSGDKENGATFSSWRSHALGAPVHIAQSPSSALLRRHSNTAHATRAPYPALLGTYAAPSFPARCHASRSTISHERTRLWKAWYGACTPTFRRDSDILTLAQGTNDVRTRCTLQFRAHAQCASSIARIHKWISV